MEEIIIFTDWYKPGFKAGGPVQSVYNLSELLSKNYKVKVVTRITDLNDSEPYKGIKANEWLTIETNHQVMYLSAEKVGLKIIKSLVKENKDKIILINGIYSFYFSFLPALFCVIFSVKKVFIAIRGMLHASALSVKPLKKQVFLSFARGFGLYNKATLLATNEEEVREIKRTFSESTIKIAPNIPLVYKPINSIGYAKNRVFTIAFIGRIAPEKNPLTVVEALAKLDVPCKAIFCGGSINKEYLETFKSLLSKLPYTVKHEYHPNVPHHQVLEIIQSLDVMVLPSLGENFGHAIYESFVKGVPVIIGNNTPWKGIESQKGGFEIEPTDANALSDKLKFFASLDSETMLTWKMGANSIAKDYCEKNNFEQTYLNLFS